MIFEQFYLNNNSAEDPVGSKCPKNQCISLICLLTDPFFFVLNKWGGISSEEHDEAVMLEAAMFGGIPEGTPYQFSYPRQNSALHPPIPRPPSPSLTAQRLLREQQVTMCFY